MKAKEFPEKDVIDFVCYQLRAVHKDANKGHKKKEEERGMILTQLSESYRNHKNAVFYIYMSIAQEIVNSKDVNAFCTYVSSLENECK